MSMFTLDEATGEIRPCTAEELERWRGTSGGRRVAFTENIHGLDVSTAFLGLDHSWDGAPPPLLFESRVFQTGTCDVADVDVAFRQYRYSTLAEAKAGHQAIVEELRILQGSLFGVAVSPVNER